MLSATMLGSPALSDGGVIAPSHGRTLYITPPLRPAACELRTDQHVIAGGSAAKPPRALVSSPAGLPCATSQGHHGQRGGRKRESGVTVPAACPTLAQIRYVGGEQLEAVAWLPQCARTARIWPVVVPKARWRSRSVPPPPEFGVTKDSCDGKHISSRSAHLAAIRQIASKR